MGWFGDVHQFVFALKTMGAELDAEGKVMIFGEPPFVGLDKTEVVVSDKVMCRVRGNLVPAAHLLAQTSYGVSVRVI